MQLTSFSYYSEADIYCAGVLPGDIHVRLVTDSGAVFDSEVFTLVVDAAGDWVPSTCSSTPPSGTPTPSVTPSVTPSPSSTPSRTPSATVTPVTPVAGCPACASTFPGACPLPGDSFCPCMYYDAVQGLCWTWASPCAGGCSDLGFVGGFAPGDPALLPGSMSGWRLPTCTELGAGPTSAQLEATGCGSCIFDPSHDHCDFSNSPVCDSVNNSNDETWLVKPCSP